MAVSESEEATCRCRWCNEPFGCTLDAMDHAIMSHPKEIRNYGSRNISPIVQDDSRGVIP